MRCISQCLELQKSVSASLLALKFLSFLKSQLVLDACPMKNPSMLLWCKTRVQISGQSKLQFSSARMTITLLALLPQRPQHFLMLHRYLKKYPALLFCYTNKQLVITRPSAERGPSINPLGQVCCRICSGRWYGFICVWSYWQICYRICLKIKQSVRIFLTTSYTVCTHGLQ